MFCSSQPCSLSLLTMRLSCYTGMVVLDFKQCVLQTKNLGYKAAYTYGSISTLVMIVMKGQNLFRTVEKSLKNQAV